MTKKKPDKVEPKRSARKKFDIPIDPEIEAWSKKLFHPIKPIIDGLRNQSANKTDSDLLSDSDNMSAHLNSTYSSSSTSQLTDNLSDTEYIAESDTDSEAENISETIKNSPHRVGESFQDRSKITTDRSFDQHNLRSEPENSSVSEEMAFEGQILSESESVSESDKLSAKMTVSFVKGELRIPNYLLKGLLPTLSNSEFVVYLWLYFLSYGFNKNSCYVSAGKLAASVNLTDRTVFRTLNSLEARGLIKRVTRHFLGKAGGITFQVNLPDTENMSASDIKTSADIQGIETEKSDTDKKSFIKDHDHDPKKMNDHEKRTIALYQDLTTNNWTQTDHQQYLQIKDLPIETIETTMRIIESRAAEKIRSFAYFAKSIKGGWKPPRSQKASIQAFIKEVQSLYVGRKLSIAELEEAVRAKCKSNGVDFDKNIFNEQATRR